MPQRDRVRVGVPLTPQTMNEIGELDSFPLSLKKIEPGGNWSLAYRIWGCHGYKKNPNSQNKNMGLLRLTKSGLTNDSFKLEVQQDTVNDTGILNRVEATINCRNDTLATPLNWTMSSRFIDSEKHEIKELGTSESATVDGDALIINTHRKELKRQVKVPFTAEWTLLEGVQRLPLKTDLSLDFNLLENLSMLKSDQHLFYVGKETQKINGRTIWLHRFALVGKGNLPWDYWLDDDHRLLAAISMNKTFWLDDEAESKVEAALASQRERYMRRTNR